MVELRRPGAAPAAPQDVGALLARLEARGGFTMADFQAAARRLRPVELQLQELQEARDPGQTQEQQESLEAALVERWRARGYFQEGDTAGSFGRRLTSDAQGVDIGVQVPPCLCPDAGTPSVQPAAWGPGQREAAAAALDRWGCTLLRGAVTAEDVAALREAFGLGAGSGARRAGEVGRWLLQRDPNIAMGRYTFGRLHCLLH